MLRIKGFDPVKLGLRLEELVQRGLDRKYYRFRGTRFYGGSSTGDVVGCNLRCIFCWSGRARDDPRLGFFVSPERAYDQLSNIALRRRYKYIRLSGGEPTIGWKHLLSLLDFIENSDFIFILETNGILIGALRERARSLAKYSRVHVRVSIKACNEEWFTKLTLAEPKAFNYQLMAINNLLDYGINFHIALFMSYGDKVCWRGFLERLINIAGQEVVNMLEPEYLVLYPNVKKRLQLYEKILGIKPRMVFEPKRR